MKFKITRKDYIKAKVVFKPDFIGFVCENCPVAQCLKRVFPFVKIWVGDYIHIGEKIRKTPSNIRNFMDEFDNKQITDDNFQEIHFELINL